MQNEYVLAKLVTALDAFSDDELCQLAALLSEPEAAGAVAKTIHSTVMLRKVERSKRRNLNSTTRKTTINKTRASSDNQAFVQAARSSRPLGDFPQNAFFRMMNNRTLFPTTRHVLDALNAAFSTEFEYNDFRKHGREPLIRKSWNYLSALPERERRELLKSFFDKTTGSSTQSDDYQELFRLLVRND